jgi:hypothetical protein
MTSATSKIKKGYSIITSEKPTDWQGTETIGVHNFRTKKEARKFLEGARKWETKAHYMKGRIAPYSVVGMIKDGKGVDDI